MSNSTISLSKSEKAYIQSGLLSNPPARADGRFLDSYRNIALETGTAPLANGSAKVNIGQNAHDGGGGTEVIAAVKLEAETVGIDEEGVDGGRIQCHVTCSPAAYPHLSSLAIEDLSADLTNFVQSTLAHPSLHPSNLSIIPKRKSWALHLDLLVMSDSGNIYDALFIAAKAALWDTRVPKTQSIEYRQFASGTGTDDVEMADEIQQQQSGLDTRHLDIKATDFELADSWDEGEPLRGRERSPVCVTLNLLPPSHYLDAVLAEEAATPFKHILVFSVTHSKTTLQSMQLLGSGEITAALLKEQTRVAQKYAKSLHIALMSKLDDEDARRARREK